MEHTPPPPREPHSHRHSLLIALVVSAVFLLASIAICIWLLTKPAYTVSSALPVGDGSDAVKHVAFIPPADMPAAYAKREQNTHATSTAYYTDAASGCSIATHVEPTPEPESKIEQVALAYVKSAEAYGISTMHTDDAKDQTIKNSDDQRTFVFPALYVEQKVDVQGVPYQSQRKIIAYKKFGASMASIEYTCRTESWNAKKDQLQYLMGAFELKIEK